MHVGLGHKLESIAISRKDQRVRWGGELFRAIPHSPKVNNEAFPPAAVVLMVSVRSVAKRRR